MNDLDNGKAPAREPASDVEVMNQAGGATDPQDGKTLVLARHLFPDVLWILPLNQRPLFPKMLAPLLIDNDEHKKGIAELVKSSAKFVGLVLRRERKSDNDAPAEGAQEPVEEPVELHPVGVVAEILQVAQPNAEAPMQVVLGAIERLRVVEIVDRDPRLRARVEYLHETDMSGNDELKAYALSVISSIKELVQLNPLHKEELNLFLQHSNLAEPGRLADFAAAMTTASPAALQDVLETVSVRARLRKVLILLRKEIDVSKIQVRIGKQIEEKLSKQQREFFLREQLKAIKKELGLEKEGKEAEVERFIERMKTLKLSDEARERIQEEIEKLRLIEPHSPEFTVSRNYLDWLTILPWGVFSKDNYDLRKARRLLDRDHAGLDDVKQRILEFLSVGILKGNISGSILCFVGPPGVGKTSLGQSIARSLGRQFYRFSVGGIRDEAEIKGHRRTYIGALPGKLIQTLKVCKSANPVVMIDEIDKIGASYHGDPASALLEVLDPEQNRDFLDHYLDVRFDLSNIFFICTANTLDTIPRPLLDRMEVIQLAGYILEEKLGIATRHLIPRQLTAHGLKPDQLVFTTAALRRIVDGYAREPGVRNLEKQLRKIMRKVARAIVEGDGERRRVDAGDVEGLLGKPVFTDDTYDKHPRPGVVMGLAWTSLGGDTLHIEATAVKADKPGFKQTGQLGAVMVESSEIAYTFIRAQMGDDPRAGEFLSKHAIHLHVPAGATPKDGPSAGITMAIALYSLALGRAVRPHLAMTGELTLTGLVMPIGGVKEKTIAARRAGVKTILFPAANRKDFEELPAHVRRGLQAHFVETFDEALALALPARAQRR